ncbi:hypothetical protein J2769_002112 [Acinetobacter guillouiae]|nr:hypothetical protein F981_01636 [Acinetobacter guillouiae CIP 63.46]MBP2544891.1 hypothetical protein [Acinetobacter guillouiae]
MYYSMNAMFFFAIFLILTLLMYLFGGLNSGLVFYR